MSWTEQQIQTLKKMWGNGHSASDIAKYLGGGITRNAVIGKAHRLKLSAGAAAAGARTVPEPPSKVNGVVMASIKKISTGGKKNAAAPRTMMRALAPVPAKSASEVAASALREPLPRPIDMIKRTEGIPVTKAGERHCRWPIGDPRSPDFRFCGCETVEGLPYCTDHARIAYQTVSRKARANANAENSLPELRAPAPAKAN